MLLTGATGFVGRAVLARLVSRGTKVLALGRSAPPKARGVTFLQADLGHPRTLLRHASALSTASSALLLGGFVVRSARPEDDLELPALDSNVLGTSALLDLLGKKLSWLGYASTIDVYGAPQAVKIAEDHLTRPRTFYGVSKLAAESLCRVHAERRGVPLAILRLSQVYGPGDTSLKAIPSFLRAALAGEPIAVRGPGTEARGYLYVDDAADAFVAALERRADGVFNLSGPAVTLGETAALAAELAGTKVTHAPGKPSPSFVLDASRARRALGFRPRVGLAEGLRRTLEALRGA